MIAVTLAIMSFSPITVSHVVKFKKIQLEVADFTAGESTTRASMSHCGGFTIDKKFKAFTFEDNNCTVGNVLSSTPASGPGVISVYVGNSRGE